jgi:hypothetical protein
VWRGIVEYRRGDNSSLSGNMTKHRSENITEHVTHGRGRTKEVVVTLLSCL